MTPSESHSQPQITGDGLPRIAPDFIEQDYAAQIDNVVPTSGYKTMPMVGLGGSAGSISALMSFFKAMPPDSDMAFVVILHLSPTHISSMAELLASNTTMRVVQAQDGQKVEANSVYVIPPGKHLATVDGELKLTDLENDLGRRVAVDVFFRSLADTHGPHAMAIILSGAGADGAIGIKRIKERGGLTIAQDPDEAEHPDMPRSAIQTGMVDWVLSVAEIPDRLLQYRSNAMLLKLPPEETPPVAPTAVLSSDDREAALREVLAFLRVRTGRDFSYYKRATILRRIARRMQVNGVTDIRGYLSFLRTHLGEAGALLQDLLISVTNFFRDRDVWAALEAYIPELFRDKSQVDTVRVWSPACATGEEAYSLAMLLLEQAARIESPPTLQVFACDIDEAAIQIARSGQYPETISVDVSDERLRKFFVKDHKGYRVRRELREMVLFGSHDLLKDPPFSRMELISCRNLLIYLSRDAQQRVLDTFHFALKIRGLMLLGTSETVDDASPLFEVLDKKHRIYLHKPIARTSFPLPSGPSSLLHAIKAQESSQAAPVVHGKNFIQDVPNLFQNRLGTHLDRNSRATLHFKLIERYAPPSVLVNAEHEIMHLSEHAGEFLNFVGGEPTASLLRVIHPALRIDLRTALFSASQTNVATSTGETAIELHGRKYMVRMTVSPAPELSPGSMLVTFDKLERSGDAPLSMEAAPASAPEPPVRHLERELEYVKGNLRNTVEQYEASTEELKASNEELQAMNEELRSATEELETSREELQSINEELTTVNQEMKAKMEELASTNSDLQNLMASTSIATVFLDRGLAIKRYTPAAAAIFNLIPGDVGRPLAHMKHRLDYPNLLADAERVIKTLMPVEREVLDESRTYLSRMQPYRTLEDHIAGVVLTLFDVTEHNRAIEALRQSEERLRLLIESAKDYAIFTLDLDRRVDGWNRGAQSLFGYDESEILGQPADILFTPEDRAKGDPEREAQLAATQGRAENERWHKRKDGGHFYGSGSLMPLREPNGTLRGYVKILRDLTEDKRTQEALREQMEELTRFNAAAVGRETRMIELKKEVNQLCQRLGEPIRYILETDEPQGGQRDGKDGP